MDREGDCHSDVRRNEKLEDGADAAANLFSQSGQQSS